MDYLVISLIIFGYISGSESDLCRSDRKEVIQVCKDGTVSGYTVYMDNREAPTEAVNCTCDVDVGAGRLSYINYSGPNYSSCGIEYILGENNSTFSCYSKGSLSVQRTLSTIFFSKMSLTSGYGCLLIQADYDGPNNVTITCHEPHVTTSMAPFITSTSVSDTKSTNTTSTTSMTRAGPVLSTGDTNQNKNSTCPCNQESTDRTVLNQCSECGSIAVVAGIIVGEAVLILLVQAVLWFLCCKRKDAISCLRKCLNKDEMKDNEAYGIVDISNINQGSRVILDTDYVNTDLNSRQNPGT